MLKYYLLFILSTSDLSCYSQKQKISSNYFHKENRSCDFTDSIKFSFYKIQFKYDINPLSSCSYSFNFKKYNENEKIKMIEELLMYENDTSICAIKIKCYNPNRSQTVPNGLTFYSVQLEALFIINHILLSYPYSYSSFPILKSKDNNSIETVNGILIKEAFFLYKNWLKNVKKYGFSKKRNEKLLPLSDSSSVVWF